MNKERIMGVARHILTFGGGYAVAKGWVSEADMLELVGAGATLIGLVWSFVAPEKKKA
nr:hypothetical protein [Amylibacter sp.]